MHRLFKLFLPFELLVFSSLVDYVAENMGQDASLAQDKITVLLAVASSVLAKPRRSCEGGRVSLYR